MSSGARRRVALLRRVKNLSWFVRVWYVPVWILLGMSRLAILTLDFRRIAAFLGSEAGDSPPDTHLNSDQERQALEIGRVIASAALRTPWTSNCFTQAVTARIVLGLHRLPCVVFFGIARQTEKGQRLAHAWVRTGDVFVTGGSRMSGYAVLVAFGPFSERTSRSKQAGS